MPENLFGEEMEYPVFSYRYSEGVIQRIKRQAGYREATDKQKQCRYCTHYVQVSYHDKTYRKCELIGYSHSTATDIRAKDTCNNWSIRE